MKPALRIAWLAVAAAVPFALALALVPTQSGCGSCDLKVATDELPTATVGVEYKARFDSDCGGDFWYIADGSLPPGIGLQEDGDLRGTPTRAGEYIFTVGIIDESGERAFKGFVLEVVG